MPRSYQHISNYEKEILELKAQGLTRKEIGAKLGFTKEQLHSDQGFQYTSQAYFNLTQAYGITPSMSMMLFIILIFSLL